MQHQSICIASIPNHEDALQKIYHHPGTLSDVPGDLGVSFPILGHGEDPLTGYGEVRVLPTTFLINPEDLSQRRFDGPITAQDITAEIERGR